MDSFFKAAVCDLDKLLDDFELNTEENECRSVFLKPSVYPFSLGSLPSEGPSAPQHPPDLNSLHYGTSSSNSIHYGTSSSSSSSSANTTDCPERSDCQDHSLSDDREVQGQQPLTAVDLLSSVDRRPALSSAPPCPDRALKPVCDLVNDTSSAIDSHDAFGELDVVEKQMELEKEGPRPEKEEDTLLLVDFSTPLVTLNAGNFRQEEQVFESKNELLGLDSHNQQSVSVEYSLLDVILPAAVERNCEAVGDNLTSRDTTEEEKGRRDQEVKESELEAEVGGLESTKQVVENVQIETENRVMENSLEKREKEEATFSNPAVDNVEGIATNTLVTRENNMQEVSDKDKDEASVNVSSPASEKEPSRLSCLPLAVSMCRVLVNSNATEEAADLDLSERTEADSSQVSEQVLDGRESPEGQHGGSLQNAAISVVLPRVEVPPEPSPVDPPEFGFEYLPESDQAELLVTDEELDAFLQAHTEAEQDGGGGVSYCRGLSSSSSVDSTQPESLADLNLNVNSNGGEEPRMCGQICREDLEGLARPESDRTMCASVEGSLINPGAPSLSLQDCNSLKPCQEVPELSSSGLSLSLTSNAHNAQDCDNSNQQISSSSSASSSSSYGGARPKNLHQRSPPAGSETEDDTQQTPNTNSSSEKLQNNTTEEEEVDEEEDDISPISPSLAEGQCNIQDLSPMYPSQSQDHCQEYSVGYSDELSEPPPYPGDSPTDGGPRSVVVGGNWKRDGGCGGGGGGGGSEELGSRQPAWVPDAEAPNCMNCYQRFTFTKRRHHCRACGKVYCAVCCNRKCKLKYLDKEARVCVLCFDTIHRAQALERMLSPGGLGVSPNPNVPSEYCSTIPPLQQARAAGTLNSPPPTVMVPVSVLKQPNNDGCPREQKRVWFADGILPNGEVADTSRLSGSSTRRSSQEFTAAAGPTDTTSTSSAGSEVVVGGSSSSSSSSSAPECSVVSEAVSPPVSVGPWDYSLLCGLGSAVRRVHSLLPDSEDELPPLLIITGEDGPGDVLVEESPAPCQILHLLEEGGPRPLTFVLNANLLVNVKLVTYSGLQCWCFASVGLQAVGQKELVFLLECLPQEKTLPRDLFSLYLNIYQEAHKGKLVEDLDNVTFTSSFLGSKDHAGVLFFGPTVQSVEGLTLPQPCLFGLLIQKLEVPWAKVFPLRLLLRLGAHYNVYPTPLVSVRFRESVFRETGHTIMNLLADLRNYQYSLSVVSGLRIHMEMGHSYIDIPKSSFNEMQKVVNASNEHVISIGARFSSEADSHLVCFQNEDGNYQTQANSKPGETRTVTGASFVVFNGALKASSGFIAKSSIVEDGLMVQIPPETMESLRVALREQTDFQILCGRTDGEEVRETVSVRWVDWSAPANMGRVSGVDGRALDGVPSVRLLQDTDFDLDGRSIRCTEVFYDVKSPSVSLSSVLSSCSVFQKELALAACGALTPHLTVLCSSGINCLWLRVSTQADMVEYQAGSCGRLLPQRYMNELDSALIPVIHGGSALPHTHMDLEFTFYITHTI